jgi:hypothetical protein
MTRATRDPRLTRSRLGIIDDFDVTPAVPLGGIGGGNSYQVICIHSCRVLGVADWMRMLLALGRRTRCSGRRVCVSQANDWCPDKRHRQLVHRVEIDIIVVGKEGSGNLLLWRIASKAFEGSLVSTGKLRPHSQRS